MKLSLTEEDYLKAIYHLSGGDFNKGISTNDIAKRLEVNAASVSDMIKKLAQKGMVDYVKYQGVTLTGSGKKLAVYIVRKHRLWETFLVVKLKFSWDEVHEIAEQLEHIESEELITRLDEYLGFPPFDPHGDPIPDEKGEIITQKRIALQDAPILQNLQVVAVEENSPLFLKHLNKINIHIGTQIKILEKSEYDHSLELWLDNHQKLMISSNVAQNLYVISWEKSK